MNSSPIGLAYHASDAGRPPKIRYRTALELDDIPAIRAEDEGFWMMLAPWTAVDGLMVGIRGEVVEGPSGVYTLHLLSGTATWQLVDDFFWE